MINLDSFPLNKHAETFEKLRVEIANLEALIRTEQGRIKALLDNGSRVSRLINQHKTKLSELEAFIAN